MLTFHGCRVTRIPTVRIPSDHVEQNDTHAKGKMSRMIPTFAHLVRILSFLTPCASLHPHSHTARNGQPSKKLHIQLNVESLILLPLFIPSNSESREVSLSFPSRRPFVESSYSSPLFLRLTLSYVSVSYRSRTMSAIASVSERLTHRVKCRGIRCRFRAARPRDHRSSLRHRASLGIKGSLRIGSENVQSQSSRQPASKSSPLANRFSLRFLPSRFPCLLFISFEPIPSARFFFVSIAIVIRLVAETRSTAFHHRVTSPGNVVDDKKLDWRIRRRVAQPGIPRSTLFNQPTQAKTIRALSTRWNAILGSSVARGSISYGTAAHAR